MDIKKFLNRVLLPISYKGFIVVAAEQGSSDTHLDKKQRVISIPVTSVVQSGENEYKFTVESPINSKWTAEIVDALTENGVKVTDCTLNKPEKINDEYTMKAEYTVLIGEETKNNG